MNNAFFYIAFSLMVISAVLSLTFFLAWKNFGRKPHALTWAGAFFAGTLQWLCALNRGAFPAAEVYALVESALAMILVTLILRGHCQRTKCKRLPRNLWPYVLAIYVFLVWNVVVDPHIGLSKTVVPAFAAIAMFMSAYMIISYRERTRPAEWAAAIAMGALGLAQVGAAILAFMQGAAGDDEMHAIYKHYNYITLPPGYVSISTLIILMMASDLAAKLKKIAVQDELTGLLNRRGFQEYGSKAFAAARRSNLPLSIIMTDIDRFKDINDKFGHAVGDTALAHFAQLISDDRRQEDIVARVGGEEFALLLPGTELPDAMAIADQLCEKVGATPLEMTSSGLPMTSSFGVATISKHDTSLDNVVLRADRALYRSKRAGRNQVDLESSQLLRVADGTLVPASSG